MGRQCAQDLILILGHCFQSVVVKHPGEVLCTDDVEEDDYYDDRGDDINDNDVDEKDANDNDEDTDDNHYGYGDDDELNIDRKEAET